VARFDWQTNEKRMADGGFFSIFFPIARSTVIHLFFNRRMKRTAMRLYMIRSECVAEQSRSIYFMPEANYSFFFFKSAFKANTSAAFYELIRLDKQLRSIIEPVRPLFNCNVFFSCGEKWRKHVS